MSAVMATSGGGGLQPFRLLGLPQEIQDKVYEHYFEGAPYAMLRRFHPSRISLQLERTCRKICQDVRRVRKTVLPRILEVSLMEISKMSNAPIFIRNHIEELRVLLFSYALGKPDLDSTILDLSRIIRTSFPSVKVVRISQEGGGVHSFEEHFYGLDSTVGVADCLLSDINTNDRTFLHNRAVKSLKTQLQKRWGSDYCIQVHKSLKIPCPRSWKDPRYIYKVYSRFATSWHPLN